jgi:hypothetical protein
MEAVLGARRTNRPMLQRVGWLRVHAQIWLTFLARSHLGPREKREPDLSVRGGPPQGVFFLCFLLSWASKVVSFVVYFLFFCALASGERFFFHRRPTNWKRPWSNAMLESALVRWAETHIMRCIGQRRPVLRDVPVLDRRYGRTAVVPRL